MRKLLVLVLLFFFFSFSFSQDSFSISNSVSDSTFINNTISNTIDSDSLSLYFENMMKYIDCNHGHICCYADCHCCAFWGLPKDFKIKEE